MSMSRELQMTWSFISRRKNLLVLFPLVGFAIGWQIDRMEVQRLTLFRDKSALFAREAGAGYKPSWP